MRYRTLGRTDWQVSEVGYGMWGMVGWTGSDEATVRNSLQLAVDLGCTFFDTAWAYGDGRSESLLGELVRSNPDKKLITATKVPPKNRRWPSRRGDRIEDVFPPEYIREYAEKSLANLGLPSVDLLQFHVWEDEWAGDEGWQRAVEELKRQRLDSGRRDQHQPLAAVQLFAYLGHRLNRQRASDLQHLRSGARGCAIPALPAS